ncbi:hypothetical protein ABH935_007715 [Catenulispora sp. GAS73]
MAILAAVVVLVLWGDLATADVVAVLTTVGALYTAIIAG